jgi:hypothetical protein
LFAGGRQGVSRLADATTDATGSFRMSYQPPTDGVLYVEATSPAERRFRLRGVVGIVGDGGGVPPQTMTTVTVNELSTVATSYALAQFTDETGISGPSPGLQNAAATAFNLVNPAEGTAGTVVTNEDNGANNDTLATLGTLADLVSLCSGASSEGCENFLRLATPAGAPSPDDSAQAIVNLARNPTVSPDELYALASTAHLVEPALTAAPTAWILVLLYTAPELYSSGRTAIDAKGNIWSSLNWLPGTHDPSPYVAVLDPVGQPTLGSPINGGGMTAGAWGAAIASDGVAWIPSFGGNALSQYSATGQPMSPDSGWTQDGLDHPQGVAVDQRGNVWIANNYGAQGAPGEGSVVVYPGGDPSHAFTITGGGLDHPFAIQIDGYGRAWVTNGGQNGAKLVDTRAADVIGKFGGSVTVIGPDFKPTSFSPIHNDAFVWPLGLAIDSANNAWTVDYWNSAVVQMAPDGSVAGVYHLADLTGPWSEAIDGSDRVWVAAFGRQDVWLLCGHNTTACGPGSSTGAILSPSSGFTSQAFQHFTAVQIDQSGNVWLSNNWSQINPPTGGVGIVAIIGVATPVCTPLQPLPVRPSAETDTACAQQVAAELPTALSGGSGSSSIKWLWIGFGAAALAVLAAVLTILLHRRRRRGPNRQPHTSSSSG